MSCALPFLLFCAVLATQQPGGYVCVLDPQVASEKPGSCPVCSFDLIPRDLAVSGLYSFTCRDHRELQQSAPGLCPKCGRKLVVEDLRIQKDLTYLCPMHPAVTSSFPGKCPRCGMELVRQDLMERKSAAYRCPMDPDVISAKPILCRKCGMKLLAVEPSELARFPMRMRVVPPAFRSGQKIQLLFAVRNPVTGEQVVEFDVVHDKRFHLFIVSQDLEYFDHIHPDLKEDGSFAIQTILPRPGYYRVYADFFPAGGSPQLIQKSLVTADCQTDLESSLATLVPDRIPSKTVDGMTVTLKSDPAKFIAGREATLTYLLTGARNGEPVRDLRPYLAAWGHTFIVNEDGSETIHSHPTDEVPPEPERKHSGNKPEISFQVFFPKPGPYRVWSQFLRNGRVSTFVFTIEAKRLH